MTIAQQRARAWRALFTTAAWMEGFDLDAARSREVYRGARLALLDMRAHQIFERTDASIREVEAALAEASARLRTLKQAPPPARNRTRRLPLAHCDL